MALTQVSRGLLSTSIVDNGNATAITIDSSENVGIGTTAPERLLHVNSAGVQVGALIQSTSTLSSRLSLMDANTTSSAKVGIGATGDTLGLYAGGSARATVDASGSVGIGTSSPSGKLHIVTAANGSTTLGSASDELVLENNGDCGLTIRSSVTSTGVISFADDDDHNIGQVYYDHATDVMVLATNDAERMRIDSSGNLLVGKTNTTFGTVGVENRGDGRITSTRSGNTNLLLNRLSSDGDIVQFYKDGTAVGSIGNRSTALFIDASISSGAGLDLTQLAILPRKDGALNNGDISLGEGGYRYKNMFLSGGVFLGGTGSANKLDDYEEGTWTPEYEATTAFTSITYNSVTYGKYTKVGNLVHIQGIIRTDSISGGSGNVTLAGLPFTVGAAQFSSISLGYVSSFADDSPGGMYVIGNGTSVSIRYRTTANGGLDNSLAVGDLSTGASKNYIAFGGTYITNA